jgi:hypothetical protein
MNEYLDSLTNRDHRKILCIRMALRSYEYSYERHIDFDVEMILDKSGTGTWLVYLRRSAEHHEMTNQSPRRWRN